MNFIYANNKRYLSELDEFKNGLPHGVINKVLPDCGGTYVAANCDSNYIIVCPFRDLVDSIYSDTNNKYNIFKCYGGIKKSEFNDYINNNNIYKIAVTYDSLYKVIDWIGDLSEWKLLVDEYHLILSELDYRENAINSLLSQIKKFDYFTLLSATPIDVEYEIEEIKNLPHYKIIWDDINTITPVRYKTTNLNAALARFIQIFNNEGLTIPNIDGKVTAVRELYIFINSVTSIKQIIDTLKLNSDEVKVCCASRIRNKKIMDGIEIESVTSPNKKINFFTKKCYQGCNLFSDSGLVVVASDSNKTQTLVDVSTDMVQIAGRLRNNDKIKNQFRNTLIHLYSTNNSIMSDEEFELLMYEKEIKAKNLLSGQDKLSSEELKAFIDGKNVESDIVSVVDGRFVYNELKKQSFIYKQNVRKAYSNGIAMREAYNNCSKFQAVNQSYWSDLNIKLSRATTVSYKQLLIDYLENPSKEYEMEYPEFKEFIKYLSQTEMNTLRYNKEKMLDRVKDKKKLIQAFINLNLKEGFISSSDLKKALKEQFDRMGLNLAAKATMIEDCKLYSVKAVNKRVNGKQTKGYDIIGLNIRL